MASSEKKVSFHYYFGQKSFVILLKFSSSVMKFHIANWVSIEIHRRSFIYIFVCKPFLYCLEFGIFIFTTIITSSYCSEIKYSVVSLIPFKVYILQNEYKGLVQTITAALFNPLCSGISFSKVCIKCFSC